MHDVIKKLTPEQALELVHRLADKGDGIGKAVLAEARYVLSEVEVDATADEVYFVLDLIDVHDCWARAGASRDGYTSPEEAAVELMEEELQPFFDQAARYRELEMREQETAYRKGVILGIYRYQYESTAEFREWAVDIPLECAGELLREWQERGQDSTSAAAMNDFIEARCPKWAKFLI
jgi:hypothetical protein